MPKLPRNALNQYNSSHTLPLHLSHVVNVNTTITTPTIPTNIVHVSLPNFNPAAPLHVAQTYAFAKGVYFCVLYIPKLKPLQLLNFPADANVHLPSSASASYTIKVYVPTGSGVSCAYFPVSQINVCGEVKLVLRASVKGVGIETPGALAVARMSRAVGVAIR